VRLTTEHHPGTRGTWEERPLPATAVLAVVVLLLLLVFALDTWTDETPVQHLYYVPIVFAAIRFGRRGGILAPLAAIALYHAANPRLHGLSYEHWDIVQVVLFVAIGLVTAQLTEDRRRLHVLATTDDLTGLANLRAFQAKLRMLVRASAEARLPLAVLVIDVDRLKSLNDVHGHLAGAEAVRAVGHLIGARIPPTAVACRYGGDEFVVALSPCTDAEGRAVGNDLRCAVESMAPVLAGRSFPAGTLSISVGVAARTFDRGSIGLADAARGEELFRIADRALYRAKNAGRNQVDVA